MAEEPQPDEVPPQPTVAEKKSEAAALSNLSSTADDEPSKNAGDSAALGAALSNLSVSGKEAGAGEAKKVKIEAADVAFLVSELDVSKKKATEMLQASQGDRMAAVKVFVLPRVKA